MTDDVRKLLGGYATGTLTEEERQLLFSAALEDEALFEALADEQALADLLEDSSARAALLHAAENPAFRPASVLRDWFSRPKSKVLAALGCVAIVSIAVQTYRERTDVPSGRVQVASAPQRAEEPRESMMARTEPRSLPQEQRPAAARAPAPVQKQTARSGDESAAVSIPRAETLESVPTAAPPRSLATTPPAPAAQVADAEAATRSVTAGAMEVRYTLLRRTPEGNNVPVSESFAFSSSDRVRLRVQANQDGTLEVRRNGAPMYTGAATAGTPILIPAELAFHAIAEHTIDIRFAPMPSAEARTTLHFREKPAMAARVAANPAGGVTAHIVLRRANE